MTGRNEAAGEGFGEPHPHTACPDGATKGPIKSVLPEGLGKACVRAENRGGNGQVQRLKASGVGIEGQVAGVANQGAGHGGEPNVPVLGQHERGHEQSREQGLVVVVANLQAGYARSIEGAFNLKGCVREIGRVQRIFRGALDRYAGKRAPGGVEKTRQRVGGQSLLVEP